jgi:hypothetical protein
MPHNRGKRKTKHGKRGNYEIRNKEKNRSTKGKKKEEKKERIEEARKEARSAIDKGKHTRDLAKN